MSSRAGIVVTGTEVLTGRVTDRNGPWLAEQLRLVGVDIAEIIIVGDRPEDLRETLTFLVGAGVDLIITSGGLGPTADDLTARVAGDFYGRPSTLDDQLEREIAEIVSRMHAARGWRSDDGTAAGVRKQALVPEGAGVLPPVGTAPGLVVPPPDGKAGPPIIVLPGPPRELQGMWPAACEHPIVQAVLGSHHELREDTVRLWNMPESHLAATLREIAADVSDVEITTCMHDGELEISTRFAPEAAAAIDRLHAALVDAHPDELFAVDGRTVDEIVADLFRTTGTTVATAESCTAGLLSGRLTDLAGSSAYVRGGLVVYSNEAKHDLAAVPTELIAEHGAVSAEVARALADGVRARLGADVGIGITGIAGPGGGSADKPVGLVYLCVAGHDRVVARRIIVPGSRADVRHRAVVVAMHMLREWLTAQARSMRTDQAAATN